MWAVLSRKTQLLVVLAVGFVAVRAIDGVVALLGGEPLTLWKSISLAVTAVGIVAAFIGEASWRWVWRRLPFLQRAVFPDLNGTWSGFLRSTWVDPETDQSPPPIPTRIFIRQGLFDTSVHLETGESRSDSSHVILEKLGHTGRHRIWYGYANTPDAVVRPRSQPHDGVAYLEIDFARDPTRLTGRYYTARGTTGDIEIERTD